MTFRTSWTGRELALSVALAVVSMVDGRGVGSEQGRRMTMSRRPRLAVAAAILCNILLRSHLELTRRLSTAILNSNRSRDWQPEGRYLQCALECKATPHARDILHSPAAGTPLCTDLPRGLPFAVPVDRVPRPLYGSGSRFYTRRARVGGARRCSQAAPAAAAANEDATPLCDLSMSLNCSNRAPNLEP